MRALTKLTIAAATALATASGAFAASHSKLSGDLKVFLDTSNPAPRAAMEAMSEMPKSMTTIISTECM